MPRSRSIPARLALWLWAATTTATAVAADATVADARGEGPRAGAVDITAADIRAFLDALPQDRVSDRPIRVVDAGGHRVGVYGVLRPKSVPGNAIRHQTSISEIYYMLEGSGTLVTGGTIVDERSSGNSPNTRRPNFSGSRIEGGVSRTVVAGDVVVIPANTPHWWSALASDIRYLIFRPDPEALQAIR